MATVINTYARAFADVVMSNHLDPAQTLAEAQQVAGLRRFRLSRSEQCWMRSCSALEFRALCGT